MMKNHWSANHPAFFWQIQPNPSGDVWRAAITTALPELGLADAQPDADIISGLTLGEARFGSDHWDLGFLINFYYMLKPFLPRPLIRQLRQHYYPFARHTQQIPWPVDARYVKFLWEVMRQVMFLESRDTFTIRNFWPGRNRFALVLTHDVETEAGQDFAGEVASLEENLGFRSSFNFVPERYEVNRTLMNELRERGFEIGVHGLKHDGKLFTSQKIFEQRSVQINQYMRDWQAVGFRADLMHRQPEWMQSLDAEYDLSFFDTDPFEPIPGGTMSIWPFFMGRLIELPYTLVQDHTLTSILNEKSARVWLEKVDFIENYHGMALVNSHPDYLNQKTDWKVYREFLVAMKNRKNYWQALPREVARWWRTRTSGNFNDSQCNSATIRLTEDGLEIEPLAT